MDLDFTFLNVLILFGALQGFLLCFYLYQKKEVSPSAIIMFILFLFSLAFLNMMYAFLDLNLFKYYRPLHMFPFPYKWLIAPAFYFYIKNQFVKKDERPYHKREWYLFIPAILYGFLRLYWFWISVSENSYRITRVIVDTNYFRIQEFFYLGFNIYLGWLALRFLKYQGLIFSEQQKTLKSIKWLNNLIVFFIIISALKILLFAIDLVYHDGQESFLFIYPTLFINVVFIYWIGFIGFTKPKYLFNLFKMNTSLDKSRKNEIELKLTEAIHKDEVFRNANLSLSSLGASLNIPTKELSNYINEVHQMNFSEFLNFYRIEKVKALLISSDAKKYTLVSLAEEAGFSSKSSFNATFKKMVGTTPSAYKKSIQK